MHDNDNDDEKSKSQIKREFHELHALGKQLVDLPGKQLQKMPLSESLREAVLEAKTFSRGALQRQLRYIAGLLPREDIDAIRLALDKLLQPGRDQARAFHRIEQWRDKLIAGDDALLDELVHGFGADRQHLRQLVRNAQKEREQNKPPRSARMLFQYLTEIKDQNQSAD